METSLVSGFFCGVLHLFFVVGEAEVRSEVEAANQILLEGERKRSYARSRGWGRSTHGFASEWLGRLSLKNGMSCAFGVLLANRQAAPTEKQTQYVRLDSVAQQ